VHDLFLFDPRDIPIMAMTAYSASDEDIAKAVPWITKEEIIYKPFKVLEICTAVKHVLNIMT
jgi:CheY-like chemotaxis protein